MDAVIYITNVIELKTVTITGSILPDLVIWHNEARGYGDQWMTDLESQSHYCAIPQHMSWINNNSGVLA